MTGKKRRTVTFDEEVEKGINKYRATFLDKGEEKNFTQAVNELLRKALESTSAYKSIKEFNEEAKRRSKLK